MHDIVDAARGDLGGAARVLRDGRAQGDAEEEHGPRAAAAAGHRRRQLRPAGASPAAPAAAHTRPTHCE